MKLGDFANQKDFINAFTEKRKARGTSLNQTSENPHGGKCSGKFFAQNLHVVTTVGFTLDMR